MIKKLFLMLLAPLCVVYGSAYGHQRIAAVAVINQECHDLVRWIESNERIGIRTFFIYPCGDIESYLPILDPYIESGVVHLLDNPFIRVDDHIDHPMHRHMAFHQALSECFYYSYLSCDDEAYFDWLILLEQNDLPNIPPRQLNVSLDLIPQQVSVIRLDWFRMSEDNLPAVFFDDDYIDEHEDDLKDAIFGSRSWNVRHKFAVRTQEMPKYFPNPKNPKQPKDPKPKRPFPRDKD